MSLGSGKHLDWDAAYREGTPPWETGTVAAELMRLVEQGKIPRGTTLEVGCGTGADAIYLVEKGYEVTAIDISPTAVERARVRAEQENALPRIVLIDLYEFAASAGQFDFVYDGGLYHYAREFELERYLDALWRTTRPGSYFLTLAGAPSETPDSVWPQVTRRQLRNELGRLFETVELSACRMASPFSKEGYPAWSCLMQRPALGK